MKLFLKILIIGIFILTKTDVSIAQAGAALNFDGINDYISISHKSLLKPSSAITIEAWIKPANIHTNAAYEIYRKEDGNNRHLFSFQEFGTVLSFGLNVSGTYSELHVPISASDYEGQWVHVAATYDGTKKKIYRNGILIGSQNATGPIGITGNSPGIIGSNAGTGEFFNGSIDEFRIWNRALSQCEIRNNMNCELSVQPYSGLIVYYSFNYGTAGGSNSGITTLEDGSANYNFGNLNNFSLSGSTSNWIAPGAVTTNVSCTTYQGIIPGVSIVITKGSNPTCEGSLVTFTAVPFHGGNNPAYEWRNNDVTIAGANGITYSSDSLKNNDVIRCVITSTDSCVEHAKAISDPLTVTVNKLFTPTVTVTPNKYGDLCSGDTVNFAAFITKREGGTSPTYQWTKNGANIPAATKFYYTTFSLLNNDTIRCIVTSNAGCLLTPTAVSNDEVIHINPVYTLRVQVIGMLLLTGTTIKYLHEYCRNVPQLLLTLLTEANAL